MPKKYTKQVWVNDSEPDLEADNLNHIENGIDNLDTRVAEIEDNGTASAISELKDVTLTSLSNGQILEYDSSASKWKNTDGGGLVLANESVAQSVANIVESPFNFAIQNGVYGYIKSEGGADTFCPFKSGTSYAETTLVDNQQISNTSSYLYPTISDDILNYDYLKVIWKSGTNEYVSIVNNKNKGYSSRDIYYIANHRGEFDAKLGFSTTALNSISYSGSYVDCYLTVIGYKEET